MALSDRHGSVGLARLDWGHEGPSEAVERAVYGLAALWASQGRLGAERAGFGQ